MKTTLTLEKIEKIKSGVEFVSINAKMQILEGTLNVKLRCTSAAVRIMSDHLVYEMKHICDNLDTNKVIEFAKDVLKANEVLKQNRTI